MCISDEVAEWLRRWTANPLCSARVGSNPILVVCIRTAALPLSNVTGSYFLTSHNCSYVIGNHNAFPVENFPIKLPQ